MSDKVKNLSLIAIFMSCIVGVFFVNLILKDETVSSSERRKLTQFPNVSYSNIMNGSFMDQFNDYAVDQFILRDDFRSIKSLIEFKVFGKKDNNNLYVLNNSIYKIEDKIKTEEIKNAADKFNDIYEKYLTGMNVYFSLIPDKSHYVESDAFYPSIDYNEVQNIMKSSLKNMTYIDIYDTLYINSYYRTDTHWKQEKLDGVVEKISKEMDFNKYLNSTYSKKQIKDFYGVYYGQLALKTEPDTITYYTNDIIQDCTVYNYETGKYADVYDMTKLSSMDKYDIFLSGATPLLRIDNPNCDTGKKLIVFRDSYGSSIIPFFIEAYEEIIIVDIRYIASSLLEQYIEFEDQDVLFLYSALVLGNSSILK